MVVTSTGGHTQSNIIRDQIHSKSPKRKSDFVICLVFHKNLSCNKNKRQIWKGSYAGARGPAYYFHSVFSVCVILSYFLPWSKKSLTRFGTQWFSTLQKLELEGTSFLYKLLSCRYSVIVIGNGHQSCLAVKKKTARQTKMQITRQSKHEPRSALTGMWALMD